MELMERWASRSDAWTPEDDVTLAELVLRHIREGSTQLVAFEEAANLLGRTAAACGYRWNGVVRRHYEDLVREAKTIRRKALEERRHRRPGRSAIPLGGEKEMSFDTLIRGLRDFERRYQEMREELYRVNHEKRNLEDKLHGIHTDSHEFDPVVSTPEQLEADSKVLLEIMERARKLMSSGSNDLQPVNDGLDHEPDANDDEQTTDLVVAQPTN